jgi:hypothetical protein
VEFETRVLTKSWRFGKIFISPSICVHSLPKRRLSTFVRAYVTDTQCTHALMMNMESGKLPETPVLKIQTFNMSSINIILIKS